MKRLFLVFIILFPSLAFASDYGALPESFFAKVESGQTDEAINYLYKTNKWINQSSDQIINLKSQLSSLDGLVGKYLFHELIKEEKVGKHYAYLIYLVGYERQPIRFEFSLYKAGDKWRFQSVSFDAEITGHIEKLANMSLLN